MDANNNQQQAGRQGQGGPRGGGRGRGRGPRGHAPVKEYVSFSPEIGEMLLNEGAVLTVVFDGAQFTTTVQQPSQVVGGPVPAAISLAAYLRQHNLAKLRRALQARKTAVIGRITALGGPVPNLDGIEDDIGLEQWIAAQDANVTAALRMSSDNFRAHMRANNQAAQPAPPQEAGLQAARAALQAAQQAAGQPPAANPAP